MIIPTISLKYQLPDSNTISETADYILKMLAGQVAYIVALDHIRVFSRFGVFT